MFARSGKAFVKGKPFSMCTHEKLEAYQLYADRKSRMRARKSVQVQDDEKDK